MKQKQITKLDKFDVNLLEQSLDKAIADRAWLSILEVLAHLGFADMLQIQQKTGFDRESVRALLKRIEKCTANLSPILTTLDQTATRAGVRGRAPQIYRLENAGAELLHLHGWPEAQASQRTQEREIMHILGMLDVRFAAERDNLLVVTERDLAYAGQQIIRPDNLVTLADGTQAIFETEQQATPNLVRRITESVQNKLGFYKSPESQNISPVVRMIVNTTSGADFQKTLKVWWKVYATLAKTGRPPFKLVAMPLAEFRELPDWSSDARDSRWVEVSSLERKNKHQPLPKTKQETLAPVPKDFLQRSTHDNRLTLEALWLWFQEQAPTQQPQFPLPNPEFFEIMQIIYAASYNQEAPPLEQAAMPWASLYLLTRYLEMHPALRKKLGQAINHGGNTMRWNPTTIMHRMQVIIDIFLGYHGWRSSGPLTAFSSTSPWSANEPHSFAVVVGITKKEILMLPAETIVPGNDQKEQVERAVAWVLWSLFAYAPYLHLSTAAFW